MEIKYDMSKNYWSCHNEAQAIVMMKRKLMKNKEKKIHGLFYSSIWYTVGILLSFLVYFVFKRIKLDPLFLSILLDLCIFLIAFLVLYFVILFFTYFINRYSSNHKGILKIDEEGLHDYNDKGKITQIEWNKVQFVAIKKYTVTFVTNTSLVVFVNIENKKDILEALQSYQKDVLIIDQSEES